IAVTLAGVGLYAVTAYGVARRTREIGIRVALGAQPGRLLWLVARGALVRRAAGLMAGLVMMNLWGRAFGGPGAGFDPGNMLSIVVVLGVVALVASMAPAARALRVDPISALRCEELRVGERRGKQRGQDLVVGDERAPPAAAGHGARH